MQGHLVSKFFFSLCVCHNTFPHRTSHPFFAHNFLRYAERLACENSRPSSLPARVASRLTYATRAGRAGGQLFSQATERLE